jgi:hypothetical protein
MDVPVELEHELLQVELAHLGMRMAELAARADAAGAWDVAAASRMAARDYLAEASDQQLEYALLD